MTVISFPYDIFIYQNLHNSSLTTINFSDLLKGKLLYVLVVAVYPFQKSSSNLSENASFEQPKASRFLSE